MSARAHRWILFSLLFSTPQGCGDPQREQSAAPAAVPGRRAPKLPAAALPRIGVSLSLVAFLFFSFVTYDRVEEDAFIYLRVAENLAHGEGYVFNRGEAPVETGSSPLWQLLLVPLHALPLPMVTSMKLLGIGFGVLSLLTLAGIGRQLFELPLSRAVPPLLLATTPSFVLWSHLGLETSCYLFVILWCVLWLVAPRRRRPWLLPAVLLLFARPESPLLAFALSPFAAQSPRQWRDALRTGAVLALALAAALALRFAYFHDLVSQPFYAKMLSPSGLGSVELARTVLGKSRVWLLLLPLPWVAWRRDFWSRPRLVVLVAGALLFGWGLATTEQTPFHRHFLPAFPFLYLLAVAGIESASGWLPHGRRGALGAAYLAAIALVVANPAVPLRDLAATANPLHTAAGSFAAQPARYAAAILTKLREPGARAFTDGQGAIERNYQALIGKFLAANYPANAVIVYDQMGQTPYYAGADKTFIDSFGLTDRTTALYRFGERAEWRPALRLYRALRGALVGTFFPHERRAIAREDALDRLFDAEPDVILVNRLAERRSTLLSALRADPRLRRRYEPRYLLRGLVELHERRERPRSEPVVPDGLSVRALDPTGRRGERPLAADG